ncbi:S46 family peptidase [Coprobacter tertius]
MKLRKLLAGALALVTITPAYCDEGMWLLPLLNQQNISQMKGLGLELCAEDIYHPDSVSLKDAVVIFGGGCTGEVISPEGLVLTNHHCGYSYIQQHSTVENDLLTNGFWAKNKKEELPNPGLTVKFIDKIEDVTDYVNDELRKDTSNYILKYLSSSFLNRLAQKRVGEEYLKSHPGILVEIKPFYGGNKYYMFTQKVYSDIRMVGAPPSSIGKYGADTDNWMWPRHTGDFSLFRIYADSDGNPAPYSENNVPLRPKKYFSLSTGGIKENDFVMLMGFPGRTNHFYTPSEVKERRDIENSIRVEVRDCRQKVLLDEMLASDKVRIQYSSKYASSTNSYKSSKGMNKMIDHQQLIPLKEKQQADLFEWAKNNNHPEYIAAAITIDSVVEARSELKKRLQYLDEALILGIEITRPLANRQSIIEAKNAGSKKLTDNGIAKAQLMWDKYQNKDYDPEVDKKAAKALLKLYASKIAPEDRPSFFNIIHKKYKDDIDRYIDNLFTQSIFTDKKRFDRFIKNPLIKTFENDGMVQFANSIYIERARLLKELDKFDNQIEPAHRTYIKGLMEINGDKPIYPDANFTIRLTYGQVMPLSPSDAIDYRYYTTTEGVIEKEDSTNWEYILAPKLKALHRAHDFGKYARRDGKMPVNFIANTHTTGGNSGSPVMNSKGELVGIGFDRNWEGISGDIQYQKKYQRTICVDIRYILFIIDKYANASYLLEELDIKN